MADSQPDRGDPEAIALRAEIAACRACADLPLGPRPILQIDAGARILIAGQAPGRRTHLAGRPFDDASGVRLRDWLGVDEAMFRDPTRFAILPMGFCFPGARRSGDLPPRAECAPLWRKRALRALVNIRMTVVIGRYAQAWHLPETARLPLAAAMRNRRTQWPDSILLPHPSPRNTGWFQRNAWFEAELLPILRTRVAEVLDDQSS